MRMRVGACCSLLSECIVAVQGAGCVFAAARARASVVRLSTSAPGTASPGTWRNILEDFSFRIRRGERFELRASSELESARARVKFGVKSRKAKRGRKHRDHPGAWSVLDACLSDGLLTHAAPARPAASSQLTSRAHSCEGTACVAL
eukprot:scaffold6305_cov116-Isochrysis_galbana.AAC.3